MGDDARLVALADAGRRLLAVDRLDALFPLAADLAVGVLRTSSASVGRIEHEHGVLRILRNAGDLADWEEPAPADETYDLAAFPLLATTPEAARPWSADLQDPAGAGHHDLLIRMGMQCSVSVPIVVGSTVWGEVGGARRAGLPRFAPGDIAAGETFAGLLAAAITRISERDELRDLAYRDALTGLGNRRAVDERLDLLFSQPSMPRAVSVILCDVDGLKGVNDRFGHDAGDRLLREVALLLSQAAGRFPGSLAARLGGDEFCLLIEGESEEAVQAATDRLEGAALELPMGAGLSCGWATAAGRPGDAATATMAARALLRLADAAQYRSKRHGRLGTPDAPSEADLQHPRLVRRRLVDASLAALSACRPTVEERLEAVALTFMRMLDGAAWAVSTSIEGGPVTIMRNTDLRRGLTASDRRWLVPGVGFALDRYPATAAALEGGVFHATMDVGDPSERGFLAANGYDELLGAGTRQDADCAWLVEICGDALSAPLAEHAEVLRLLVEVAVAPARTARRLASPVGSAGSSA